jgi:hypothetical protein
LWRDDPAEFVRVHNGHSEESAEVREIACDLLVFICGYNTSGSKKKKKNTTYLKPILMHFGKILDDYKNDINAGNKCNVQLKEAALYAIGNLSYLIKFDAKLLQCIEGLLHIHVLPEIQNGMGIMRFRAMYLYS